MNQKQTTLNNILDIVISCCATEIDGESFITSDRVLSHDRHEVIIMTRCILANQIVRAGFSVATVAIYLHRTLPCARHILKEGVLLRRSSRAYKIADDEASRTCDMFLAGGGK